MRRLLILLSGAALLAAPLPAAAQPASEDEEMVTQLRAAVGALREEIFRPGPPVEDWNVGGADPDAELTAAGADRHYFLLTAQDGDKSVVILTDRPIADFAPAAWRMVDSYGAAREAVARPFVQFSRISPRYMVATRSNGFRRDNIDCSDRVSHAYLYALPSETTTEDDAMAPMMFRLGLLAMEGMTTCTRYSGSRAEGWAVRPLLPDGRSLPSLETPAERLTIVPAAPIDELMRL
jgi:hypothetical protein